MPKLSYSSGFFMSSERSLLPVCEHIKSFKPYEAGLSIDEIKEKYHLSHVIKMASNENPFGFSKKAKECLLHSADNAFRYPQSGNPRLVKAIYSYYHKKYPFLSQKQIFVGNGSDEIIDLLFRTLTVPGKHNAVMFKPCFDLYATQAKVQNCEIRTTPLHDDFSFDFAGLRSLVDENTALVFVTSPDNPSGRLADKSELAAFARSLPKTCLLVVDEAYIEFAGGEQDCSLMSELAELENLAVMRTFSKVYGLAGMRIGYIFLPEVVADYMWRIRLPFSVNILAQETAVCALEDEEFKEMTVSHTIKERTRMSETLKSMGCTVYPSHSNFIMFEPHGISAKDLCQKLLERGIIIRALGSYGLPHLVRVSVGTSAENEEFLSAVQVLCGKGNLIVTVDGPAGVGKSTLAKKLAKALGIAYLDTGAMYRSLALRVGAGVADLSENQMHEEFAKYSYALQKEGEEYVLYCNGEKIGDEIRTEKASRLASIVAKLPEARKALQKFQREIGRKTALVAEGRDMGTVVFPDASVKFFLDARPEVRAKRRFDELALKGQHETYESILAGIAARDEQDRNRAVDPLAPHKDAVLVDTSDLDIDGVFRVLVETCRKNGQAGK